MQSLDLDSVPTVASSSMRVRSGTGGGIDGFAESARGDLAMEFAPTARPLVLILSGPGDVSETRRSHSTSTLADPYATRPLLGTSSTSVPILSGSDAVLVGARAPLGALAGPVAVLAVPVSASQIAQFSITMVMLAAAGRIGVEQMGGASIALGLVSATAFAFSSGLCGALETLLSQSYGADPTSKLYGIYAQRMLGVLVLVSIPLSVGLAGAERALVWLGEPKEVAVYAGRFCHLSSMLAVGPVMLLELLRRYLVSQRLPNPVLVVVLAAALANPILVYVAVGAVGYDGVAVAFAALHALMDVGLLGYLYATGVYRQTWGGWSLAALREWGPLLRLALPSLAMALSEWTMLEANTVVAGLGTPTQLAAFAVSSQLASLCWALPSGVFMAATVLIGNSIGSGANMLAKRFALVTTGISLALALMNVLVVLTFRRGIASFFTTDAAVVELFANRVLPWMLAYHVADALSSNSLAIMRGVGIQRLGMIIVLGSIAVVGTPMGVFMFLRLGYGVEALWVGPLLGFILVGLPAHSYVLLTRVDWARLRVAVGSETMVAH